MVETLRESHSSTGRGAAPHNSLSWDAAINLVELIEHDVRDKVEAFLVRRRPAGRSGVPSYTEDEVLSFARSLVSHQLEGVRTTLREQETPSSGLRLDPETMLPQRPPVWLQHSRTNLEFFAPLRKPDLLATTKQLQERIKELAETQGGLPLGDGITIRTQEDGGYWACYDSSVLARGDTYLKDVNSAREEVWARLLSQLDTTHIHKVVPELTDLYEKANQEDAYDFLAVSPRDRQRLYQVGRERQSLAAIQQLAQGIVLAHASQPSDPSKYILTLTQIVSKLASQARPGGEFSDVRLFRLVAYLALRATYILARSPESDVMQAVPKDAREELANYVLERIAVLLKDEYELPSSGQQRIRELCKAGRSFLKKHQRDWLYAPLPPPKRVRNQPPDSM